MWRLTLVKGISLTLKVIKRKEDVDRRKKILRHKLMLGVICLLKQKRIVGSNIDVYLVPLRHQNTSLCKWSQIVNHTFFFTTLIFIRTIENREGIYIKHIVIL